MLLARPTATGLPPSTISGRTYLKLALIGMATALLASQGDPGQDTLFRLRVTHALWTREPVARPGEYPDRECLIPGRGGQLQVSWGIGQSLALLPADVLVTGAIRLLGLPADLADRARITLVCWLTFGLLAAAILVGAAWLLRLLGFTERQSVLGALGLQFATSLLPYTQINQENSLLLLTALLGLACHLEWLRSGRWAALLGGCGALGFALLVRITALLDVAVVGLVVAALLRDRARREGGGWRVQLVWYAAASVAVTGAFLALDRLYQWIRFGSIWTTYYGLLADLLKQLHPGLPASFPYSTPLVEGFLGALFARHRSVFLFDPLLALTAVLALWSWWRLDERVRAVVAALFLWLLGYASLYARFWNWGGASAWGDRYLLVPAQLLGLLALPLAAARWGALARWARPAAVALVGLALAVQVESLLLWVQVEESQMAHWGRPVLVVWQRAVNVVAVALGRFEAWGLAYPGYTTRQGTWNFVPFLVEPHVAPAVARAIQAAWGIGLVLLAILVAGTVARAGRVAHSDAGLLIPR